MSFCGCFCRYPDNDSCSPCPQNCTSCASAQQCETCVNGYALSSVGTTPLLCANECGSVEYVSTVVVTLATGGIASVQQCASCAAECAACDGPGLGGCTSCRNLRLQNGTCATGCPALHFETTGACEPCSPQCASACTGPLPSQCASSGSVNESNVDYGCAGVYQNGECVSACTDEGWFLNTSTTCEACHPSCRTCDGPGSSDCTACVNTRFLSATGQCSQCHPECGGSGRCSGSST
jgi:proprotein convertase subtilisin/kexin type 5